MQKEDNMANKVVIVTGSTSGIGLGIAKVFAKKGYHIMLNGFGDPAEIENTRALLERTHSVKVGFIGADMSKPEAIKDFIHRTSETMGSVDIIVNNAGIQYTAEVDKFPVEKWDAIMAINLSAVFHMTQHALPLMKAKGWGRIINIASAHGLVASKHKAAYVAAKHGVLGLTKVIALETAELDITANSICPGWVLTPLVKQQIEDLAEERGESFEQSAEDLLTEKQPSKKFATPEQIGELAAFLASDAAEQITGAAYPVDGGWTAR
jgi:3-hydroxybutyrate dehydrogenase